MGPLRKAFLGLTAAVPVLFGTPLRADEVGRWAPQIAEASSRYGVPARWIEEVMRSESRGRARLSGRPIRSSKGAMGLMQLMPGTWAEMRERLRLGRDPDDPRDNILAGTFYLRLLYDRYGYPGLFAAYNAGPGRYEQHLAGRPLPAETVAYLAEITGTQNAMAAGKPAPIFASDFVPDAAKKPKEPVVPEGGIDPLFAIRRDSP
jgi:soluble lytic murein transglycosylase-like protein